MIVKLTKQIEILREYNIREARKSFWHFCTMIDPILYKEHRHHLKTLCENLQDLYEKKLINPNTGNPYRKLILSMPPRHGKSRTLVLFCAWLLGVDVNNKIISTSYNNDTACEFSRFTRDTIEENTRKSKYDILYSDMFPKSKIKQGDASVQKWSLEGQFFNYLGSGTGGSVTGRGCNILICDDLIKNEEEANNEALLDKVWKWYTGTLLSRKEEGSLEIVCMTRWNSKDPIGRIKAGDDAINWYDLCMKAYDEENDTMLCPDLLSKSSYEDLKLNIGHSIIEANYQQNPVNEKGRLYTSLMTYTQLPPIDRFISYTDTADKGSDALVTFIGGIYNGDLYITDIYYSLESMETTEVELARVLFNHKPFRNKIEGNNGGEGFARNVRRLLWETHNTKMINIETFHQSKNKESRILTASSYVNQHVFFPLGWEKKYKEVYAEIYGYQKNGKNKHEDCCDSLTGLCEMVEEMGVFSGIGKIRI